MMFRLSVRFLSQRQSSRCIVHLIARRHLFHLSSSLPPTSASRLVYVHRFYATSKPTSDIETLKTLSVDDMRPVSSNEIQSFLTSSSLSFSEGFTCYVTTCPRHCRRKLNINELDKLYINTTTGYFVCQSCKKTGSWNSFKENTRHLLDLISKKKRLGAECLEGVTLDDFTADSQRAFTEYNNAKDLNSLQPEQLHQLQHGLGIQGLKLETLQHYNVRATADGSGLVLPVHNFAGALVGIKIIHMVTPESGSPRVTTRTIPRIDYYGLFGWLHVKPSHSEVILTASEFDAMAVYQETGLVAVSLPKGTSILPQKVLPQLEQFSKVILWFGGDTHTWQSTRHFALKLNEKRCHLIRPDESHPNALSALYKGISLQRVLQSAKSVQHKSIVTFRNLRYDVYSQLANIDQTAGIKWKRYPIMNNLLKGHRRGELTVFTGPTGSGKTTFISDYSLDLCLQGVNTLWGSFEINNVRLMKTMLTQFAQLSLSKNLERFDEFADRFEQLPMYFMTFHGQENIRKVIETMSHAVYVHDIAHVIVDNLQFMLGVDSTSTTAADRFYRQDVVISLFRSFATNMNCHVTLVIHPRKERESEDLTVASIFGSAKVSQEADNILILQDKRLTSVRGRKYVQVAKNRYDGELGIMLLKFDKDTLSFSVKPKDTRDASHQTTTT